MIFPIKKINENIVETRNSLKTYVYEIFPSDLDQLTQKQISFFISEFVYYLNGLSSENFYKIYVLKHNIFINTNDSTLNIPGFSCKQGSFF